MAKLKIGVVVYEHCTSSMVTGFWDIFQLANHLAPESQHKQKLFELDLIGVNSKPINSFSGLTLVPRKTIQSKLVCDLIYVPGFLGNPDEVITKENKLIKWLSKVNRKKTIVAAACNGNLLLAESGILKRKHATTHWNLIPDFRAKYPDVIFEPEKIVIDNGDIISAAGVTSFYNLGLHIIQKFASPEIALQCAKVFLVDAGRKLQLPYQCYQAPKNHGDESILSLQNWMETNLQSEVSVGDLADRANLGVKTLVRRFKKATGEPPLYYLQKLRMEAAKRMLEGENKTFNEITLEVGYTDVSSFHRKFKIETGLTPVEYRSKFSLV